MFYTVYKITNILNNKIYIGKHQTKDPNDNYMGSGKLIKDAIKKYGIENFKKEILFQFDNEVEMNFKEAELVTEEFCLREDTYNICPGGQGGWGFVNNELGNARNPFRSLENQRIYAKYRDISKTHNTCREKQLGFFDPDVRKIANEASHTPEAIEKKKSTYSKINHQKGNTNSQFGTMWIHSIELKQNKKIKKNESVPDGWNIGRKLKFTSS
jgi:hypothetical protein